MCATEWRVHYRLRQSQPGPAASRLHDAVVRRISRSAIYTYLPTRLTSFSTITTMRLSAITLPLLALAPFAQASLAGDALNWANALVSSDPAAKKGGVVHTMDSWSYSDCGLASDAV